MYRWIVARIARRAILAGVNGKPELATRMMADDVIFEFPGTSSFGASLRGKDALLAWMRRFAALKPAYVIRDVVATGPPWNTRLAVRLSDRIGDDYANEGVQYLRMRWGKVISDEVFVDTEKVADLERCHPEIAVGR
jgi:ketosteroid isomerase-like protein